MSGLPERLARDEAKRVSKACGYDICPQDVEEAVAVAVRAALDAAAKTVRSIREQRISDGDDALGAAAEAIESLKDEAPPQS